MNRKAIIQIVIVVAAFGGSGVVLYNGFFKPQPVMSPMGSLSATPGFSSSSSSTPTGMVVGKTQSTDKILPSGQILDFKVLTQQNFQFGLVKYPKLDYQVEVNKPVGDIFAPQ